MFCASAFFNDTATTEIYTLSLHDALPISYVPAVHTEQPAAAGGEGTAGDGGLLARGRGGDRPPPGEVPRQALGHPRSEEHTSELQSRQYIVCRLLLEKKHTPAATHTSTTL